MIAEGLIKLSSIILSITINVAPASVQAEYLKNPILEIPKINLKQEFYPNDKVKNNVNKNIQVIDGSSIIFK